VKIFLIILVIIIISVALAGRTMSLAEQPESRIVKFKHNFEIRDDPPMIVAEVEVSGERELAIHVGFKILADYIFGNNISNQRMEIKRTVSSGMSEKMAMTAPVMQQNSSGKWKIRFVTPKKSSFKTLPRPRSDKVVLTDLPASRFAVIRFSGLVDESMKQSIEALEAYILAEKFRPLGEPILAFYNPPWTIPFLRRNEIMIELGTDR
jgi:DNA gyrase inhibitor GyrI